MNKQLTLLIVASLSVTACSKNDPVSSFESIAKQCEQAIKDQPPSEMAFIDNSKVQRESYWVKRQRESPKVTYDVKKTDSLVSPFSASIIIEEPVYYESGASEAEVKVLEVSPTSSPGGVRKTTFGYVMKEEKWEISSYSVGPHQFRTPDGRIVDSGRIALEPQDIAKNALPLSACLP